MSRPQQIVAQYSGKPAGKVLLMGEDVKIGQPHTVTFERLSAQTLGEMKDYKVGARAS